jgi:hypothetical protein
MSRWGASGPGGALRCPVRSTRRGGLQRRPAICCGVRRDAWTARRGGEAVAVARQQRARNSAMSMSGPWQVVQSGLDRLEVVLLTRRIEKGPGRRTVVGHASAIPGVCALGGGASWPRPGRWGCRAPPGLRAAPSNRRRNRGPEKGPRPRSAGLRCARFRGDGRSRRWSSWAGSVRAREFGGDRRAALRSTLIAPARWRTDLRRGL